MQRHTITTSMGHNYLAIKKLPRHLAPPPPSAWRTLWTAPKSMHYSAFRKRIKDEGRLIAIAVVGTAFGGGNHNCKCYKWCVVSLLVRVFIFYACMRLHVLIYIVLTQGSVISLQLVYSKREWVGCARGNGEQCVRATCPGWAISDRFKGRPMLGRGIPNLQNGRTGKRTSWRYCWIPLPSWERNLVISLSVWLTFEWMPYFGKRIIFWCRCWAQVFKIYALGKSVGDRTRKTTRDRSS